MTCPQAHPNANQTSPSLSSHKLASFANLAADSYFVSSEQDIIKSRLLLPEVTAEATRLEREFRAIRERKELYDAIQAGLKSHISLVSRLPAEILQQIFDSAIDWSPLTDAWFTDSPWWRGHRFTGYRVRPEVECHEYKVLHDQETCQVPLPWMPHGSRFGDLNQSPWNVSRVCKRWRDITLSTPKLWTYFEIDLDWDIWVDRRQHHFAQFFDLALSRSHPHGISLVITGVNPKKEVKRFLHPSLIERCERWERIFSFDRECVDFPSITKLTPSELPLLRNVAVYRDFLSMRTGLPNLKTWYWLCPVPLFDKKFTRHSAQVSSLACHLSIRREKEGGGHSVFIQGLEHIRNMDQLLTLRITPEEPYHQIDEPETWPKLDAPIQLHTVRDLSLGLGAATEGDPSEYTLSLFVAPSLKTLHLLSLPTAPPLVKFITQSNCSLSSLRIESVAWDSSDLLHVLRQTPRLEFLNLTFLAIKRAPHWRDTRLVGIISNELLEQIFKPDKTLLPLLRQISLFNLQELDLGLMLGILHQRLKDSESGGTPPWSSLEYIRLTLPGPKMITSCEETLRYLRCRYRLYVQIAPWNLYHEDSSSDGFSEAQFTSEPSDSQSESDSGAISDEDSSTFDWLGVNGLIESEEDLSDEYTPESEEGSAEEI